MNGKYFLKKLNNTMVFPIVLMFIVIVLSHQSASAQGSVGPEKRILVLHSLESNRPFQVYLNRSLRKEMNRRSFHPYVLDFENLDLLRFHSKSDKDFLQKMLERKYSAPQPDILIIVLSQATQFMAEYKLFPDVPKIYITIEKKSQSPKNSVGGFWEFDFKGNLKHSLDLFPDTKKVFVVSGNSTIDKNFEKAFRRDTEELKNQLQFEYLWGLTTEKILSQVEKLPDHSLVYYLPYGEDPLGRPIIAKEFAKKLGERANRPVFTYLDLFVEDTDILGGRITSVESWATWAAEVVWRVFKGEDITSIKTGDFDHMFYYNWPKLKKWGLDEATLPPNSVILNKKYTFFELYQWQIFGGLLLLLLESFLILILFVNINRRKKAEVSLREHQAELEGKVLTRTRDLELMVNRFKIAKEEAETANHTKNKFFTIIAHDLKNPITSMSILFNQILHKRTDLDENMFGIIKKATANTQGLLNNLLTWARSQQGEIDYDPKSLEVCTLLTAARESQNQIAEQKEIIIKVNCPEKIWIKGDSDMLATILRNLLSNAIKFTPKGGEIQLIANRVGEQVEFKIIDSGVGMRPEVMDKLFRLDEKIPSSLGTNNETGTGLGLTVCQEFISRHGSHIHVKSELGKGSSFSFTLTQTEPTERSLEGFFDLSHYHVLIVDDNALHRQTTAHALDHFQIQHQEVVNGVEALEKASQVEFDLILMDIDMPMMDGIEATHQIRRNLEKPPLVIALSSYIQKDLKERLGDVNFTACLNKPLNEKELLDAILPLL